MKNFNLTVGLFGSCDKTTFRKDIFIPAYENAGISYFNPQLGSGEWDSSFAPIEAKHLAKDGIILFPIVKDSYSMGSLAEVGFSVLNAIKLDNRRDFIVLIDDTLTPELMEDSKMAKESLRARALVKEHLISLNIDNIYLVNTLQEMLSVSLVLSQARFLREGVKKYCITNL